MLYMITFTINIPPMLPYILLYTHIMRTFTLWLFNIAMENGLFIDGLPIKHGDFPWLC